MVAVFGGAGLLGHRVVADLRAVGHRVVAIGRAGHVGCDEAVDAKAITDSELTSFLTGIDSLKLIVNAIGVPRSGCQDDDTLGNMIAINALWSRRLAVVATALEIPLVHISTDAVFSDQVGEVDETSPPTPDEFYGCAKLLGEPESTCAISLRCSLIGPDPHGHRGIWSWVVEQPKGAEIDGFTEQQWTGVTSRQLAGLIERLLEPGVFTGLRTEGPVHHICPNKTISKFELVTTLARVLRPDVKVRSIDGGRPVTRKLTTQTGATALITGEASAEWDTLIREAAESS